MGVLLLRTSLTSNNIGKVVTELKPLEKKGTKLNIKKGTYYILIQYLPVHAACRKGTWNVNMEHTVLQELLVGGPKHSFLNRLPYYPKSDLVIFNIRLLLNFWCFLRGPCFLLSPICCPELKDQVHNKMHLFEPFWLYKSPPDGTFYNSPFFGCLTRFWSFRTVLWKVTLF